MIDFAQLVIVGLVVGSIIGLGAMGLTLSYGIMKFANFAHGDMMSLGMFLAYAAVTTFGTGALGPFSVGWAMIPALLLAMLGVGSVAAGVDQIVYRPLRRRGSSTISMAIASLGVAIMVRALIQMEWGPSPVRYASGINRAWTLPGELKIRPDQVLIVAAMLIIAVAVYLLLFKTRLGKAMRATSDNAALAEISGIDTERIRASTWVIAGGLIAVAGVMFGIQSQLKFDAGFEFLLPMFAAVILGGIGNPWGALVGGLIVGISQETSTYWIPTGYKTAVPFILLTIMLVVRPRGLFGSTV